MKKLTLVFTVLILVSSQIFASNDKKNNKTPNQQLRNEISFLLKKPKIELVDQESNAHIQFTLNNKGEIVILSVDSDKETIESFVKNRLNYQKVAAGKHIKGNQIFQLKLKILKPLN